MTKFELALAIWAFLAVCGVLLVRGGSLRKVEGE